MEEKKGDCYNIYKVLNTVPDAFCYAIKDLI